MLCRSSTDLPGTVSRVTFIRRVRQTNMSFFFLQEMFAGSHGNRRDVNGNLQPVVKCVCGTCTADFTQKKCQRCCRVRGSKGAGCSRMAADPPERMSEGRSESHSPEHRLSRAEPFLSQVAFGSQSPAAAISESGAEEISRSSPTI